MKISGNISKENTDSLNALCTTLALLRELVNVGEDMEVSGLSPRTMVMTPQELATAVRWDFTEEEKPHPIKQLESLLKVSLRRNILLLDLQDTGVSKTLEMTYIMPKFILFSGVEF